MDSNHFFILERDMNSQDWEKFYSKLAVKVQLKEKNVGHDLKWYKGRPLTDPDELPEALELHIAFSIPKKLPDFEETMKAPIVSATFKEKLMMFSRDITFYPLTIKDKTGKLLEGFFAMNILTRERGVDRKNSILSLYDDDRIVRIKELKIEQQMRDRPIFRLDEYPEIIVVNKEVANLLRGLKNVKLTPADGWSDKHFF